MMIGIGFIQSGFLMNMCSVYCYMYLCYDIIETTKKMVKVKLLLIIYIIAVDIFILNVDFVICFLHICIAHVSYVVYI